MSRGGITPHTSAGPKKGRSTNPPSPVQSTTKPQRNDQEEIWECICSLGKKIHKDFKKSGTIQSSVKELEKEIQDLKIICEQIYLTGKDLGIDVDDEKQHDVNSSKETITCLLAENRKLSKILIKLNKEVETVDMQQKYACKDKKKIKTSKQSDKHHSDLSDETPLSVFKAFDDHAPRIIEILKNESMLQEQKSFAQCPIRDAYWSSEKEKKLLSLQEQNKSHEDSLITLLNDKRDMAEKNSELKRKLEASERNFLKKSKEADNLICEKQTFEENCRKRLDQETRHRLAQMQKEMQERDFTSYK